MSLAFPSPEFIPPTSPPPSGADRPRKRLHRQTLVFFFVSLSLAAVLEFFPLFDRTDPNHFIDADRTELGFPLPYLMIGTQSTKVDFAAFLADILAVGALVIALTCWMERYLRWLEWKRPWYKLYRPSLIFLGALILGGFFLESFQFTNKHTPFTPYTDLERGVPFSYHQFRLRADNPPTITFDSTTLVLDLLLLGLTIAEMTYWFERWQRRRLLVISEEK